MTLTIFFWIVFLLWILLGWIPPPSGEARAAALWPTARNILLVILLLILGWGVFGAPIQGGK